MQLKIVEAEKRTLKLKTADFLELWTKKGKAEFLSENLSPELDAEGRGCVIEWPTPVVFRLRVAC